MKVKIKRLSPDAVIPRYETGGAACFDLTAISQVQQVFGTGLSFEVPDGHVMLVFSRSGHGFKHGIRLANCVGVIDSDYRGEVKVKLHQDASHLGMGTHVRVGDRVAQAMILPVHRVEFEEVNDLTDTQRGTGGFGSTDK